MKLLRYLRKRLGEKSTWLGFTGAITGASPYSGHIGWLLMAIGVIMVLIPEPTK